MRKEHADAVIVGAGLSGLYTALLLNPKQSVVLLVKTALTESNSQLAQGGIAAEMKREKALLEAHIEDTLTAGHHLNDMRAVTCLVNEAHENIDLLLQAGVQFDRDKVGDFLTTIEGGHSSSRVLHSGGDATGRDIMNALQREAKRRKNIRIFEQTMAVDLDVKEGGVQGLSAIDKDGKTILFSASSIILATGGVGSVYAASTNPPIATGDGIAMAERAGATIEKMAFIQFHPTAFFDPEHPEGRRFLISEALRGEGAVLRNLEGDAFMEKYHPKADLAPRDIVSQGIHREMYDTWSDHVYLDTRHLEKTYLQKRFPTIQDALQKRGYSLGETLIPIAPVEHFNIGGISTDLDGKTDIERLYALGECASTGVHGANRLASNSLLECVVFGRRIANHINSLTPRPEKPAPSLKYGETASYHYGPMRKKIRMIMEEHAGIVRRKKGLEKALSELNHLLDTLMDYPNHAKRYYETMNMLHVALNIVKDALNRPQSIGCHFRID